MKNVKKWIALFLVLAMACSFVACSSQPSTPVDNDSEPAAPAETDAGDGKLSIGFSLPSLNFPFYVRMYDTFVEECEKRGWTYQFVDGNLDSAVQLSGCNDLINKDIDILVMATWWIDAMQDVFDQCEQRGIQVYLMDNMEIPDVAKNAITFTTGTDNYNAGWVGGTWAAEQLKAQGKTSLNLVTVRSNNEMPLRRCSGFSDALTANGINLTILQEYDAGERPKAMTVIEDALVTYNNVDMIFGASAQDSLGAYDACVAANRTEVLAFGFDGEDDEISLIDKGTQYMATITQDPVSMSRLVAEKIQDHYVDGNPIDQAIETPAGVYCSQGQLDGATILEGKPAPEAK